MPSKSHDLQKTKVLGYECVRVLMGEGKNGVKTFTFELSNSELLNSENQCTLNLQNLNFLNS